MRFVIYNYNKKRNFYNLRRPLHICIFKLINRNVSGFFAGLLMGFVSYSLTRKNNIIRTKIFLLSEA